MHHFPLSQTMMQSFKEKKDLDDAFKKAQKSWQKLLDKVSGSPCGTTTAACLRSPVLWLCGPISDNYNGTVQPRVAGGPPPPRRLRVLHAASSPLPNQLSGGSFPPPRPSDCRLSLAAEL